MLNSQSPLPLYHQLAEMLTRQIRSGEFLPGDMIPSENEMAKEYGIGRPTVRQAMDLLVRKGLIERKRGSGTYVKERSPDVDLFSLAGTSQAFHTKGIRTRTTILEGVVNKPVKGDSSNPFNKKKAFFLSRIIRDEKGPILMEEIYLDSRLFPGLEKFDMKDRSLSQVVSEHYYLKPVGGRQSFRIIHADAARAAKLDIEEGEPILEVTRTLDFTDAADAIFSRLFCLTDRFSFSQTIGQVSQES